MSEKDNTPNPPLPATQGKVLNVRETTIKELVNSGVATLPDTYPYGEFNKIEDQTAYELTVGLLDFQTGETLKQIKLQLGVHSTVHDTSLDEFYEYVGLSEPHQPKNLEGKIVPVRYYNDVRWGLEETNLNNITRYIEDNKHFTWDSSNGFIVKSYVPKVDFAVSLSSVSLTFLLFFFPYLLDLIGIETITALFNEHPFTILLWLPWYFIVIKIREKWVMACKKWLYSIFQNLNVN